MFAKMLVLVPLFVSLQLSAADRDTCKKALGAPSEIVRIGTYNRSMDEKAIQAATAKFKNAGGFGPAVMSYIKSTEIEVAVGLQSGAAVFTVAIAYNHSAQGELKTDRFNVLVTPEGKAVTVRVNAYSKNMDHITTEKILESLAAIAVKSQYPGRPAKVAYTLAFEEESGVVVMELSNDAYVIVELTQGVVYNVSGVLAQEENKATDPEAELKEVAKRAAIAYVRENSGPKVTSAEAEAGKVMDFGGTSIVAVKVTYYDNGFSGLPQTAELIVMINADGSTKVRPEQTLGVSASQPAIQPALRPAVEPVVIPTGQEAQVEKAVRDHYAERSPGKQIVAVDVTVDEYAGGDPLYHVAVTVSMKPLGNRRELLEVIARPNGKFQVITKGAQG